MLNTINLFLWW